MAMRDLRGDVLRASTFAFRWYDGRVSTVPEIEKAILSLTPAELEKLEAWWVAFRADESDAKEKSRLAAISATSGCLAGAESDDLEAAVVEAAQGSYEDHAW